MSIEFYDGTNHDGWFDIFGKAVKCLNTLNTARLDTVPPTVLAILTQFEKKTDETLAMQRAMQGIPATSATWVRAGDGLASGLRGPLTQYLIELIEANDPQPTKSLANALEQFRLAMVAQSETVKANTVGASLVTGGSNVGDAVVCYSKRRWDGKEQEHLIAEDVAVTVVSDASPLSPSLKFVAAASVPSMAETWPAGSGCAVTVAGTDASSSLLLNGDFEDETVSNQPDYWIPTVGVRGTDFYLTDPEVQTVAMSGTPTAGTYVLKYTNAASVVRATDPLAYNATSATVQAALRLLPGLEAVTVVESGTTPNLTHTITFTGVAGNITELSSVDGTTGGSHTITHATTTSGDAGSYKGKALCLDADGSTLTALQQAVSLDYETVYFLHCRVKRVGAAATGTLKIEIIDGIGGSVTTDGAGNNNEITITVSGISTGTPDSQWLAFSLPKTVTMPVYVRIRFSVAPTATASVYIDEMALVAGRRLYAGGPYVAVFTGATASVNGDSYTLTTTNDRAGGVHEAMNRFFNLVGIDMLLPSAGSPTIPEATIA